MQVFSFLFRVEAAGLGAEAGVEAAEPLLTENRQMRGGWLGAKGGEQAASH